jgi:hypothetical protein
VGATMLHLLTGRPPREFMTAEGRIEVPAALPAEPRVRDVLARMLRASPAERFASAREVRQALLGAPVTSGAPSAPSGAAMVVRESGRRGMRTASAIALPPAPRALEGETAATLDRLVPDMWSYMNSSSKPSQKRSVAEKVAVGFLSALTVGVLPLLFWAMTRQRRSRLTPFLRDGLPAEAEVLGTQSVEGAFGEKLARVSYQFEADGQLWRDADQVLPYVADRWVAGDRIQVLYLPAQEYDSVIVSTS